METTESKTPFNGTAVTGAALGVGIDEVRISRSDFDAFFDGDVGNFSR